MNEISRSQPGLWHQKIIQEYGKTLVYKGFMNTNRLCTVDVRGLGHILKNDGVYQKVPQFKKGLGRILGEKNPGLVLSEGDEHRQQRKIMNPAFSLTHIRSLLPNFYEKAHDVRSIWSSKIDSKPSQGTEINVLDTLSHMALDIIGETGFGYHFNSLTDEGSELATVFATVLNHPEKIRVWDILTHWFPALALVPTARRKRMQLAIDALNRIGGKLVKDKKDAILKEVAGQEVDVEKISIEKQNIIGKDMLSVLIRSNMATDLPPNARLSDGTLMSQISTFVLTGHETTATGLTWALHTLSLPEHIFAQDKLREEILAVDLEDTDPKGGPALEVLEGLEYLDAVVRECLRWTTIVPSSLRICMKDDVVPLSDGKSIRVKKGDGVFIPIVVLNKSEDVWGEDALKFKPERWLPAYQSTLSPELKQRQRDIPGVYSDLMSFLGGPRSCIGVKFSVLEMKAVLFILLRSFKFKAVSGAEITTRTSIVTRPFVKGRENEGSMMPLTVEKV